MTGRLRVYVFDNTPRLSRDAPPGGEGVALVERRKKERKSEPLF